MSETYLSLAEMDRRMDALVEASLKEVMPVLEDLENQGCLCSQWRLRATVFCSR